MHDQEKSDSAIVAVKPSNKAGTPAAEAVEPRAGTKGNADQQSTRRSGASPSHTRGRSRMLESGSSGSVRGASSNGRPYREPGPVAVIPDPLGMGGELQKAAVG